MLTVNNNNKPLVTLVSAFFLASIFTQQLFAEVIGKILAQKGECFAFIGSRKLSLKQGDPVVRDEKLVTGTDGFLQLRLMDKSIVALRPNSEYQINQYNFSNDKNSTYQASLQKGQFRQLAGLIAKKNPTAYKIQTPLSTLNVRGTYFGHRIVDQQSIEVSGCWHGLALVRTPHSWLSIGPNAPFKYSYLDPEKHTPIGLAEEVGILEGLIPDNENLNLLETIDFQETLNDFLNDISGFEQSVAAIEDIELITDLQQLNELQDIANEEPLPPEPEPEPEPPEPPVPPEPPIPPEE
ncbi:FecR family protein [Legionella hackeliae]|uniref:FecR protein domain-containing protein n=1 Tax=Legionella hackeliae TaxID=449 RepID=A0A0A8UUM2_LEGHA|nr:FecR domain-containing protein [Legionella hackeliae]KTD06661.1 FecR protein [Legionella hackeliae]CEK10782.1 exported protein of unknown function [FecR domain] [Legionella hackeliae]STX47520.1 FecR protein [Legionella hackeliae]